MKNKQKGLSIIFIVILLAGVVFAALYKDKDGATYLDKGQKLVEEMKSNTIGKAEEAKKKMESRDAKLQQQMKDLE